MGGDFFQVLRNNIRASLLLFNPGSRPNAITHIQLSVSDGAKNVDLYSLPSMLTLPEGTEQRKTNWLPQNIQVGSGVEAEMMGWDYKAVQFSRDCTLIVQLKDVFGRNYTVRHHYKNNWPREKYPDDVN